jgi:hypothetical protein
VRLNETKRSKLNPLLRLCLEPVLANLVVFRTEPEGVLLCAPHREEDDDVATEDDGGRSQQPDRGAEILPAPRALSLADLSEAVAANPVGKAQGGEDEGDGVRQGARPVERQVELRDRQQRRGARMPRPQRAGRGRRARCTARRSARRRRAAPPGGRAPRRRRRAARRGSCAAPRRGTCGGHSCPAPRGGRGSRAWPAC